MVLYFSVITGSWKIRKKGIITTELRIMTHIEVLFKMYHYLLLIYYLLANTMKILPKYLYSISYTTKLIILL